jgi:hypothetical protein
VSPGLLPAAVALAKARKGREPFSVLPRYSPFTEAMPHALFLLPVACSHTEFGHNFTSIEPFARFPECSLRIRIQILFHRFSEIMTIQLEIIMSKRKIMALALSTLILNAGLLSSAEAANVRVKCEKRGTARSSVSVDVQNADPKFDYYTVVTSGANAATSELQSPVGDEVEFDFDSDPRDIAAGDTAIGKNFIVGGRVSATVFNDQDFAVGSASNIVCRTR